LYAQLKVIAIAMMFGFLMMCCGCSTTNNARIHEYCLSSVVTYGDVVECAIKLNEMQK
jgi:hypothetical protein